jgi:hypothetical protein
MRRLVIASIVTATIVAVSSVACGGGKPASVAGGDATPAATTDGSDTATGPAGLTDGSLTDAMLTVDDLPAGWSQLPDDNSTSKSKLCNGVDLDQTKVSNATSKASRTFTTSGTAKRFLIEALATLPGSDASKALTGLREAMTSCGQWSEPSGSGNATATFNLRELSFPRLGDDSFAFRVTSGTTTQVTGEGDFAYVRHGHSLLIVMYAGVSFTGPDTDQWVALARSADDKVRSHGVD